MLSSRSPAACVRSPGSGQSVRRASSLAGQREACFQMAARRGEVAQMAMEQGHHVADVTENKRVAEAFGEAQSLLGEGQPGAQFSAEHMEICEPPTRQTA
jgi:hypothetical protein